MALPDDTVASVTRPAAFLAPRDEVVDPFLYWERGGVGLNDASQGLNVYSWLFTSDGSTGEAYVGVPGVVEDALVHTIDPLPVQVVGSFDTNMQPMVAWVDVDGDAFLYWNDPVAGEYVELALPAGAFDVHLAIDDVRRELALLGQTDTILAYVVGRTVYYRQLRDRFDTEYEIGDGFSNLYQIGMNAVNRFQFSRSPTEAETPALSYLRKVNRAGKFAGFDAQGDAMLHPQYVSGVVGADGPVSSATQLMVTESGQTFFLRDGDGVWRNQEFEVLVSFYKGAELRGQRALTFTADDEGLITRADGAVDQEAGTRITEAGVGTQTYSATVYLPDSGLGVTFHLIAVTGSPVTSIFTPSWNGAGDFYGGGFVPTGRVHGTDYGPWVVLRAADATGYTSRSASTRLRWGAGSLPVPLRPLSAVIAPCRVSRAGVELSGEVQLDPDGSAEFWPLTGTDQLTRGTFLNTDATVRVKGLPVTWQLAYVKPDLRLRATATGARRITENGNPRRVE